MTGTTLLKKAHILKEFFSPLAFSEQSSRIRYDKALFKPTNKFYQTI